MSRLVTNISIAEDCISASGQCCPDVLDRRIRIQVESVEYHNALRIDQDVPGRSAGAKVEHGLRAAVRSVFTRVVPEDDRKAVLQLRRSNFVRGIDPVSLEYGLYGDIDDPGIAFERFDHPL